MNQRRIESFLLRLVVTDRNSATPEAWQGRIQHVGSGYERQIQQLSDLVMFIREHVDADARLMLVSEERLSVE